ncbi:MAG: PadR family transcriptional regulator [Acholeplasmataceae bacterium]|jgi:DNA-binding PadR family transcriptional regulator
MSTKYALLGLLNIRKMSAYDLSKFAKESIGYFWNESYSNVHRTLNLLAKENLVTKLSEPGSRKKIIFEITEKGQNELSKWLSNHQHTTIYRDELLLKLFVSKKEDYPSLLIDLKNVLNELEIQQQIYLEMQTSIPNIKKNLSFDLTLEYGIIQNQVTIDWLKNTIKRIKESL